jgi:hypothetical protein
MTHAQHLEDMLAATVEHVKALHATLSAVMVEVAALRQTVVNEPNELARFDDNMKRATGAARPLVQSAMRSYDELVKQIADAPEGDGEASHTAAILKNLIQ